MDLALNKSVCLRLPDSHCPCRYKTTSPPCKMGRSKRGRSARGSSPSKRDRTIGEHGELLGSSGIGLISSPNAMSTAVSPEGPGSNKRRKPTSPAEIFPGSLPTAQSEASQLLDPEQVVDLVSSDEETSIEPPALKTPISLQKTIKVSEQTTPLFSKNTSEKSKAPTLRPKLFSKFSELKSAANSARSARNSTLASDEIQKKREAAAELDTIFPKPKTKSTFAPTGTPPASPQIVSSASKKRVMKEKAASSKKVLDPKDLSVRLTLSGKVAERQVSAPGANARAAIAASRTANFSNSNAHGEIANPLAYRRDKNLRGIERTAQLLAAFRKTWQSDATEAVAKKVVAELDVDVAKFIEENIPKEYRN
eukprot:TRINITY_DN11047_c0_g2_i1.p1 TRINITY_DN11047_c0_g2~~TRINITY_DN11047_c0_g2_i1.p1  ORF type:complete len:366 (+),score=33.08 TRINITY_DN11047_c0_g2_i1:174-1271(+)